jgi:hypothetical protein
MHPIKCEVLGVMRETVAKGVVALGAGLALMLGQGWCQNQAGPAPVQPMVSSSSGPQVQPDSPVGSLAVEGVDPSAGPRVERAARRPYQVPLVQAQSTDAQATAAAVQARQDERLLKEQEAASQRQQYELDQEIEQHVMTQQEMEAEPRIQEVPETAPQPAPLEPMQPQ